MMLDAMDVDWQLPEHVVFEGDHGQSIEEIRLAEIERNLGEHEEPHWTGPDDGEELEFFRPPSPRHGGYLSIPILEELQQLGADIDPLKKTLKPFQERASDAETRLAKHLEALLLNKDGLDCGSETCSSAMKDLQSKLGAVSAECLAEKEKNRKLTTENEKLTTENKKQQYRITHLIRAVKEADSRLKSP